MHQLQHVADQLNRNLRANSRTQRCRNDERHAGLHVLGGRMSCDAARLHNAPKLVRRRRRSWRNYIRYSDTDATTASKLNALFVVSGPLSVFAVTKLRLTTDY